MSIANRGHFRKGWPSPQIVEKVAQPSSGVTTLQAFMIGHLDLTADTWTLGVPALNKQGYVFHNDQADPDSGNVSTSPTLYNSVLFGGVHGISLQNPLLFLTSQYGLNGSTAIAKGDALYAHTDGKLYVGALAATPATGLSSNGGTAHVILAICTQSVQKRQGTNYIEVQPVTPYAVS